MRNGGLIPWDALAVCDMSKTSWQMRKLLMKGDSSSGAMVECYPISAKDQSRHHQFGKNVLPGIFFGYALCAGRTGQEPFWSQTLRSWKIWTRQNHARRLDAMEIFYAEKR